MRGRRLVYYDGRHSARVGSHSSTLLYFIKLIARIDRARVLSSSWSFKCCVSRFSLVIHASHASARHDVTALFRVYRAPARRGAM
jgi:hypothetical protein